MPKERTRGSGFELNLDQLLTDDMTKMLLKSDGVDPEELREEMDRMKENLRKMGKD